MSDLEKKFNQRKRATLESILAEMLMPYEELRSNFEPLSPTEIFTMLTGETKESLTEHMIVPVTIKRTFPDRIEVKLACGIEGTISENEYPEGVGGPSGVEPRQVYQIHQTVQAKIMFLSHSKIKTFFARTEKTIWKTYV